MPAGACSVSPVMSGTATSAALDDDDADEDDEDDDDAPRPPDLCGIFTVRPFIGSSRCVMDRISLCIVCHCVCTPLAPPSSPPVHNARTHSRRTPATSPPLLLAAPPPTTSPPSFRTTRTCCAITPITPFFTLVTLNPRSTLRAAWNPPPPERNAPLSTCAATEHATAIAVSLSLSLDGF